MWDESFHGNPETKVNYTDWMADVDHPNPLGHRFIADMVIGVMRHVAEDLSVRQLSPADDKGALRVLPVPMYKDNWPVMNNTCLMQMRFKDLVAGTEGFEWVNEGTEQKQKWGMVGRAPGSWLQFKINTAEGVSGDGHEVGGHVDAHAAPHALVVLAYLKSYEHMGQFKVECAVGCECGEVVLDGHWTPRESQTFIHGLTVTKSGATGTGPLHH